MYGNVRHNNNLHGGSTCLASLEGDKGGEVLAKQFDRVCINRERVLATPRTMPTKLIV